MKDEASGTVAYTKNLVQTRKWDDKYYLYPYSDYEDTKTPISRSIPMVGQFYRHNINNTFMKLKNLFLSALCVITLGMLASCTEKTPEGPVYSDKPFDAISLEVEGETVEGVVVDNTISFRFTTAENFSAAKLILNVNDGWKLVFPADPGNYDVSTDPNIYFTDPNGKKVQYVVTITSNALPVADGSKCQWKADML